MKVLVIGSGGREHAICWKLAQSPSVEKVMCLPGNPGISLEEKCECLNERIDYKTKTDRNRVVEIALNDGIDLTIVGPEEPLVHGIVDDFRQKGLRIIGPEKAAARLEGSKDYAKTFMAKYGVRTSFSQTVNHYEEACKSIEQLSQFPIVIKADGLAAGKGVYICSSKGEAKEAVDELMNKGKFGESGKRVLIEEFLEGEEVSVLALTDSKVIVPLLSSKDHKRLLEGDKGPNTGGMGVVAPNPVMTDEIYNDFVSAILNPTLKGIKASGFDYRGIVFFGLMVKDKRCYLLEYNVRMGDPETEAILPLMASDLAELFLHTEQSKLDETRLKWHPGFCVNLILASEGYPNAYKKGKVITGCDRSIVQDESKVFFAGVGLNDKSELINTGGRVLSVSSTGDDLESTREKAYKTIKKISFEGSFYRKDIGLFKG
jgi:phosphoribosylamine--glycine ligase